MTSVTDSLSELARGDSYCETPGLFRTIRITSIEDIIAFSRKLTDPFRFVYRGVRDERWKLETRVERGRPEGYLSGGFLRVAENAILTRFQRRAHHYLRSADIPGKDDHIEWLALIQHYGGPTRLLDFTRSIFVAAYFAINEASDAPTAGIWAVNHQYMDMNWEIERRRHFDNMVTPEPTRSNLTILSIQGTIAHNATIAIEPFRQNRRLLQQQGLFIVPLNTSVSFQENLAAMFHPRINLDDTSTSELAELTNPDECAVIRFLLDKSCFRTMRADLKRMNISTETMFPDLAGEAMSLADIITDHVEPELPAR
jgi:hypothetical protein